MKKKTIVLVGFSRKNEIRALTRERSRLVFGAVSAFVSFEPLQTGRRFFLLVLSALVVAPYRALAKRLAKGPLVYLTWRYDPTTTIVVNWMDGDARSNDYVMYRRLAAPAGSRWSLARGFKHLFADQKKRIVHHVELRGLQPDTEYMLSLIHISEPTRPS